MAAAPTISGLERLSEKTWVVEIDGSVLVEVGEREIRSPRRLQARLMNAANVVIARDFLASMIKRLEKRRFD